ncbi:carboxypeptidase A2-like [Daphnia pulicaria]|uniref:carboxypeptidase A2-like n=1 Tax=Daphnia pulicaria TaxID=35523 RepID=UPI001EEB1B82|nr:carboxypeptidase A2-like [Daphnia pulicaria]
MNRLIIILVLMVALAWAQKTNYRGYKLLRVTPETTEQLAYLVNLSLTPDTKGWPTGDDNALDFWRDPTGLGGPVDILTNNGAFLERELTSRGMYPSMLMDDVQSFADQRQAENADSIAAGSKFTETYHTYEEIIDYLDQLAGNNSMVSVIKIGESDEVRDIVTAQISSGGGDTKPAIYLECGMHAREWIAHSTCLWIIDELTTLYGQIPEITSLVDRFDWFITPVSNPDGYVYSWLNDRLWRKNRKINPSSPCIGVDTNRNFDANFGGVGSSDVPCSDTYSGPSAFSEAESRAMRDILLSLQGRTKAVVSIHNNAQVWLSPYGYTTERPVDYDEMERVMSLGAAAIEETYGTQCPFGPGSEVLYFTSGTTKDYVYGTLGVTHGYTLELRNTADGFITPTTLIAPVATEAWNGIKAMANAIA